MKKKTVLTFGAIAASASIVSCSSTEEGEFLYEIAPQDIECEENELLPIRIYLNDNDASYLNAICRLTKDITESTDVAQAALDDPNILNRYGYNGCLKFDSTAIKLIKFFANKEIAAALKDGNTKKFEELCITNDIALPYLHSPNLQFYKDQLKKLDFSSLGLSEKSLSYLQEIPTTRETVKEQITGVAFFAAAVFYVGVAVNVLAVENIYYFHYYSSTKYTGIADSNESITYIDLAKASNATNEEMEFDIRNIDIEELIKQLKILIPDVTDNMSDEDLIIIIKAALDGLVSTK